MPMDPILIGRRIKAIRLQLDLSQASLAECIDKSPTFISRLESGLKKPSLETLVRVADAFDVPIDYLLHNAPKQSNIQELLSDCTPREIRFIEGLIPVLITYFRANT